MKAGAPEFIYSLINGPKGRPMPSFGPMHPTYVHVADVARAHVLALKAGPSNARKRILVQGGYLFWRQAAEYLVKTRPKLRDRLPDLDAVGGDEVRSEWIHFEAENAERVLGMAELKTWQEMVDDTVDELLVKEKELRNSARGNRGHASQETLPRRNRLSRVRTTALHKARSSVRRLFSIA